MPISEEQRGPDQASLKGQQWQGFRGDNFLDRHSTPERLEYFYDHVKAREALLWRRRCPQLFGGQGEMKVLSVGCGPDPARGMPTGSFTLVGVDSDPREVERAKEGGNLEVHLGTAGQLPFDAGEFDVVVLRLVLHHIVFQGSIEPALREAARVLKPGGTVVAIEPNIFHPVGTGLALANRLGLGERVHGTVDDCPLSPFKLGRAMKETGLRPRIYGLTYSWRRLPLWAQKVTAPASRLGTVPPFNYLAHTVMAFGKKRWPTARRY